MTMQQGPMSMPMNVHMGLNANQMIKGTWANSGVDINLDNLTKGGAKKAVAPSMNQLQSVTPVVPPVASQPHPGLMMSPGMMQGMMMSPQPQPQANITSAMNGNVIPPNAMLNQPVRPTGGMPMPMGMPGAMTGNMVPMMGQMQPSTGPMSMPNNLGL